MTTPIDRESVSTIMDEAYYQRESERLLDLICEDDALDALIAKLTEEHDVQAEKLAEEVAIYRNELAQVATSAAARVAFEAALRAKTTIRAITEGEG